MSTTPQYLPKPNAPLTPSLEQPTSPSILPTTNSFTLFALLGACPKEIETLRSADHSLLLWCHNSTWNTTACHKFHLHPYDTGVAYRKLNHCRGEIMFRSTTAPSDDHPIMRRKPEVVRAPALRAFARIQNLEAFSQTSSLMFPLSFSRHFVAARNRPSHHEYKHFY